MVLFFFAAMEHLDNLDESVKKMIELQLGLSDKSKSTQEVLANWKFLDPKSKLQISQMIRKALPYTVFSSTNLLEIKGYGKK